MTLVTDALALESRSGFHPANRKSIERRGGVSVVRAPFWPDQILISPGNIVGTTYYDVQSNGSTGNRIVIDGAGGIHFAWTDAGDQFLTQRNIAYRFISENGDTLPSVILPGRNQAGFCAIDIYRGAVDPSVEDCAVAGFHNSQALDDRFASEISRGSGSFSIDSSGFPSLPGESIWPAFTVDINDNIHALATQSNILDGGLRYHVYSRRQFGSSNWSAPMVIDTTYSISPVITSSHISSRTAIAWSSPAHQDSNEYDNDIFFLESLDGVNWNIPGGRTNITNYPPSVQNDTTFRAYSDLDAIYDFNDNLHIIWNASYVTRDSLNQMVVLYHSALFHWSANSGIDVIYDHPVRDWGCDMGAWNLSVAKMSIGVDPDSNFLYVTFTRFDPSDYARFDTINGDPNPCGGDNIMPCANGELYLTWSRDGGNNWQTPVNITDSPSPDCLSGDCDSDNWSSLAEIVGDYLHILYINDKDAGGGVYGEGDVTSNPVMYLKIQNPTRTLGNCQYVAGDINGNGSANGIDVVYGVSYFKGGEAPPFSCDCPPHGVLYVTGDVNGNCIFNGIDLTYFIGFLKGGAPLGSCVDCPPGR